MTNLALKRYCEERMAALRREAIGEGTGQSRTEFLRGAHEELKRLVAADAANGSETVDSGADGEEVYPL